eukprot:COSAG06_NODE_15157_length_1093_cov_4.781690_1_plen_177_part_00
MVTGGFAVLLAAVLSLGSGAVATVSVGFPPTKGSKQYLMLETFDVATDIIAVWFTSDAGDLEFANDPLGLVKIFLVISVVISCVSYVVEMFLRCSNTMNAHDFRECLPYLQSFHFACEDVFQATLYALAAGAEAAQDGEASDVTYGTFAVLQALFFIAARLADMYPSRMKTNAAAA